MSSLRFVPAEKDPIDVVVLAGTQGTRLFQSNGRLVGKPYLEIGNEPLVRRVVRTVLASKRVGKVFVVGEKDLLAAALGPLRQFLGERLKIVAEGEDILDNCYRAFFQNLLPEKGLPAIPSQQLDPAAIAAYRERHPEALATPALFVTSDLPFLTSEAIDRFLELSPGDAALVFGLVDHRELEQMRTVLGERTVLDRWKLGAIHLRRASVRLNNLFLVRPLLGNPILYTLLARLYAHRWLLRQDGSIHWRNWWGISRAMIAYSLRLCGRLRFLRGLVNFIPTVLALCLARLSYRVARWLSWPFRLFLDRCDLEFIGSLMLGAPAYLAIGRDPSPAIDIDVEESHLSLIREGEKDFKRIARYLEEVETRKGCKHIEFKAVARGGR